MTLFHHNLLNCRHYFICRINNCDICNITDWIHRIERKCPQLEQLSCMGNPGIQTVFKNHGTSSPASYAREYIFEVLPNLKYLDGVPRHTYTEQDCNQNRAPASSSCNSVTGQGHESSVSTSDKAFSIGRKVTSPTLSFKEFFRLKPAKKTANVGGGYLNGNGSSTNWSPAYWKDSTDGRVARTACQSVRLLLRDAVAAVIFSLAAYQCRCRPLQCPDWQSVHCTRLHLQTHMTIVNTCMHAYSHAYPSVSLCVWTMIIVIVSKWIARKTHFKTLPECWAPISYHQNYRVLCQQKFRQIKKLSWQLHIT